MNSLESKILTVHPDTKMVIRKMYNFEKQEDMDRAIDALEEWLKKQYHLIKKDYSRDFLERSIIFMKGSVERAKSQIDNLCSMRTIFPKFFEKYEAKNDFNELKSVAHCAFLPKLTKEHYRVYVTHVHNNEGITFDMLLEAFRFGILKCEYIKAHDYCTGFIGILDYRKINILNLISIIDWITTHQLLSVLMEGYGMRIKGIHLVTPSKAVDALVKIFKPMLGPKVSKRFHVHTKIETIYDYVPKDVLPCELGGDEESIAVLSEHWRNLLGTKENVNYLREMSKAESLEAHRIKDKLNGLDLGTAGTFRSLSFD